MYQSTYGFSPLLELYGADTNRIRLSARHFNEQLAETELSKLKNRSTEQERKEQYRESFAGVPRSSCFVIFEGSSQAKAKYANIPLPVPFKNEKIYERAKGKL